MSWYTYPKHRPMPWPSSRSVQRLYVKFADLVGVKVYVHQTAWPRQPENPNWRIEVDEIDGRYPQQVQERIRVHAEHAAREFLRKWLAVDAPFLSLAESTWPDLVRFAVEAARPEPSPYQRRRQQAQQLTTAKVLQPDFRPPPRRATREWHNDIEPLDDAPQRTRLGRER